MAVRALVKLLENGWPVCGLSLAVLHLHGQGGALVTDNDYPPVALGRLDDRSGWHWLNPRPVGVTDWTLTLGLVVLAVPVLLTFGMFTLALRAVLKVGA